MPTQNKLSRRDFLKVAGATMVVSLPIARELNRINCANHSFYTLFK